MSTGEVEKRFDAHKSMSSIADGFRKPERPTVDSLRASVNAALDEETPSASDNMEKRRDKSKYGSLAAKIDTDSAKIVKNKEDNDNCSKISKSSKASKSSKYSKSCSSLKVKLDAEHAKKVKNKKDIDNSSKSSKPSRSCSNLKVKLDAENGKKEKQDTDNRSKSSKSSKSSKYIKSCSNLKVKLEAENAKKEEDTDNRSKSSSKSKTRPYSKCPTAPASSVPRRRKPPSRSKSSDGLEFPRSYRNNTDNDNSKGKKTGLVRSKSSVGSKRETTTPREPFTARNGGSKKGTNIIESHAVAKPLTPLAPNVPPSNSIIGMDNHQKQPALKTDKTMDEMIHLAWIKPIQEKEKETSSSKKHKDGKSSKKDEKISGKKSKGEKSASKKKSSGLDQKLGKAKGRKMGNNDEDVSVASSVIKPKTSKVSTSEWDDIAAEKDFALPDRKMSWFGFSNAAPKDDSSCEGSGLDQSFSSIEGRDDDSIAGSDGSINIESLLQDMQEDKDADANNHSPSSSSDESIDESSSSSDDSSSDEPSTDSSSSESSDKKEKGKNKVSMDARADKRRASQLRKLQRKKNQKKKKIKRGAARDAGRGTGGGLGGRSLQDEQLNGSKRIHCRRESSGLDSLHHSVGPGIYDNARSGHDPFAFGDNGWPSNDTFDDFNTSSQHRGGGNHRHNRSLRSRSHDDSTARYDGRGGEESRKGARRGVRRTRSTDGGGVNNSRSNWDGGANRRGGRKVSGRRAACEDPTFNDFNSSPSGNFKAFSAAGAFTSDPLEDFNNSFSGSLQAPSADPFGSADPFVDLNNSQSSFRGNSSSRGTRSGGRARGKDLQNEALMASLHASQDQLSFVHAGKWMTEKEQEAFAPPRIQPWETRKKDKAR